MKQAFQSSSVIVKRLNSALIILLISVCFFHIESVVSQTRYKATQETAEFKITTINTEWLSCSTYSPTDDELQINNLVKLIKTLNSDLIALQEVGTSSTYTTIDTLVRRLGSEWGGNIIPYYNSNCGQNQGIIYKKSKVQPVSASLITNGGASYDWSSGRYPALYEVNLVVGSNLVPVSFINIHSKAMSDADSYTRRRNASIGLKALLDGSTYNTKKIILLGDFNDYLIGTQCSTCSPLESPYKNFMDDTDNYKCLTSGLYDTSYSSPVIDNIIISNELVDNYKQNSTIRETTATQTITNYISTTTDHTPVSASFSITVGAAPECQSLSYSEPFSTSLSNFTPNSVTGLQVWYWRQGYGACVSGYANAVNNPNEDWLISPAFNLLGKNSATLSFNHALNYATVESDRINNHSLWISNNYTDGAPANATWTQLTIPTMPTGSSWTFVNSGNINIPTQMLQSNVRFAFKYISSATVAGTWEIKDLLLNADCVTSGVPTVIAILNSTVYASGKQIKITNKQPESARIYDITGRILFSSPAILQIEVPVDKAGVYVVHVGNEVHKVIVK
ncbi:MAG: choice-of-anchor J domain-containing protein [Paludibacter sp.]|nr:choice-of-anchor J domain-containing protein [Paludibacter sp.]